METETSRDDSVVSISSRTAYRPKYENIAAGWVRAAREKTGKTRAEYAAMLSALTGRDITEDMIADCEERGVLPGTVLAAILTDAGGVLPSLAMPGVIEDASLYPGRGLVARHQWNGIIRGSRDQLWLCGMAEFGYATDDEVPDILAEAVEAGCEVRVLLLDPGYEGTEQIDADEGSPKGTLESRIRASLVRFVQMRDEIGPQVQIRTYGTHPTVSIVRGDGHMLVTPYLQFTLGSNSPTLELADEVQPKTFARYVRHLNHLWNRSKDWTS